MWNNGKQQYYQFEVYSYLLDTHQTITQCTHVLTENSSPFFCSQSFHFCLPVAFTLVICHIYFRFLAAARCPDICPVIQSVLKRKFLESV